MSILGQSKDIVGYRMLQAVPVLKQGVNKFSYSLFDMLPQFK